MGYSRMEQETSIVWDEEEQIAHIYAASPVTMRKLDKLVAEFPDVYKCVWIDKDGSAKKYEVTKRLIRFGKPASEARKEAARERMRANFDAARRIDLEETEESTD